MKKIIFLTVAIALTGCSCANHSSSYTLNDEEECKPAYVQVDEMAEMLSSIAENADCGCYELSSEEAELLSQTTKNLERLMIILKDKEL